ncbi:protein kinase [Planomonospora sp. ID67723]|uniref:protein kinase domain-containing protein n=1 Tax=Planomonospora sp. ID67723 TaxID=2738134 RepID=UPI0018C3C258|nr:protein kinase [Planomonospora sp. ID67723]MBG0830584.1 protein kinase [Planomonospora sp. ID67723]
MPVDPPPAGDPSRIGAYRITGRLGAGGQGVVYLAVSPSGDPVAVKLLRSGARGPTAAEFDREIELALRVKAFCTAQVLEHGEFDGAPYIVSEYVDGPTLARVISERGALRGAELRRLAIGTLTALSAIHQAGVVHRDFKPANVLLPRDGPRVIDFGIAQAADSTAAAAEHVVGTPPYMAPEQFSGSGSGAASDMFAWAATVTCAATGSPPFGTGPMPALIHRILSGEPQLGGLDGQLRELVLECLAKNPAVRPTATAALLRLLGHPVPPRLLLAEGRARAGGRTGRREEDTIPPPSAGGTPSAGRRRTAAGLAAVTLAVASGFGVYLARAEEAPVGAGPAGGSTASPSEQRRASGTMAPVATTAVRIPGTGITLREDRRDPWRVTSYQDNREYPAWGPSHVRATGGDAFERLGGRHHAVVSPGGSYVAISPEIKADFSDFDRIRIVDRSSGQETTVQTVRRPEQTRFPRWSPDGSRLLLTVLETVGWEEVGRDAGFVIVDAASRRARLVRVADDGDGPRPYAWGPDGTTVVQRAPGGSVDVRNLDGTLVRTLRSVGEATPDDVAVTSVGAVVTTICPDKSGNVCLWDYVTGAKKATVPIAKGAVFGGWLGERNLLAVRPRGKDRKEVVMIDLRGDTVRVLADGPAAEIDGITLRYTLR